MRATREMRQGCPMLARTLCLASSLLAAGCHLVFPYEGGDSRPADARGERWDAPRGDLAPPDIRDPCAGDDAWTCSNISQKPPKCELTCGDRKIACTSGGFISTCTCSGSVTCSTTVTYGMTEGRADCDPLLGVPSACRNALQTRLACCKN